MKTVLVVVTVVLGSLGVKYILDAIGELDEITILREEASIN